MRARGFAVLSRAVEEGVAAGYRRAHKHSEAPGEETICEHVEREVLGAICEVFAFDDEGEDA